MFWITIMLPERTMLVNQNITVYTSIKHMRIHSWSYNDLYGVSAVTHGPPLHAIQMTEPWDLLASNILETNLWPCQQSLVHQKLYLFGKSSWLELLGISSVMESGPPTHLSFRLLVYRMEPAR